MKYVNATALCYGSITMVEEDIASFNAPLNSVAISESEKLSDFVIVSQFNFLGSEDPTDKKNNVLLNRDTVDVIIRLTKCDHDPQKRIGYDIDSFSIDLDYICKNQLQSIACFEFYNHTRITKVHEIPLPGGAGNYVIKILMKKSTDTKYTIQFMSSLKIA